MASPIAPPPDRKASSGALTLLEIMGNYVLAP
jgi:hypothetical protein